MNIDLNNPRYKEMLEFVEGKLKGLPFQGYTKCTYNRYFHIRRVLTWALRLYEALPDKENIDLDSLVIACILHDVGYCQQDDVDNHQIYSEIIARNYLTEHGFDAKQVEFVCYLIANHSHKRQMFAKVREGNYPKELILLLEADELDDTGAMAAVEDIWLETMETNCTFESILTHLEYYSSKFMDENRLITEEGRRLWSEKNALLKEFYLSYKNDIDFKK